jgi:hypothetical protein
MRSAALSYLASLLGRLSFPLAGKGPCPIVCSIALGKPVSRLFFWLALLPEYREDSSSDNDMLQYGVEISADCMKGIPNVIVSNQLVPELRVGKVLQNFRLELLGREKSDQTQF